MRVNLQQFVPAFWLIGAASVLVAHSAEADTGIVGKENSAPASPTLSAPVPSQVTLSQNTDTSLKVTSVQLKQTDAGIEVILQTADGTSPTSFESTYNQTYVADFINSKLQLPSGNEFRVDHPAPGIASVSVTQMYEHTVRVKVIGEEALPTGRVVTQSGRMIVSLTPGVPTAQKPAPTPTPEVTPTPTPPQATPQPSPTPSESPTPTPPLGNQPPSTKPETTPTAPGSTQQPSTSGNQVELPPITVIGKPDTGYRVPNASVGTKTPTPLRDVPQSIQVIPRTLIDDVGANTTGEVLTNLGLAPTTVPNRNSDASQNIRGFETNNIQRNGLKDDVNPFGITTNLANIERIEVLRGPASVLYGQGRLNGTINIVTKQPLREPYYAAQLKVGSFGLVEPSFDLSGPLTKDGSLLYRFNAAYQSTGSFIDFRHDERIFVAPVISWQIGKDTKLTIQADYQSLRINSIDEGLPLFGTLQPSPYGEIPRSRYLGDPTLATTKRDTGHVGYDFEHRFSENLSLHSAFQFSFVRVPYTNDVSPIGIEPDNRTLDRVVQTLPHVSIYNSYDLDNNLVGKFKTGSLEHQLLVGVELQRFININSNIYYRFPQIDVFNPVYGQNEGDIFRANSGKSRTDQLGIYVQDQIALTNNLKLVAGGRWDNVETLNSKPPSESAFSPRVGIVYQPIQPVSLYASYSRSFVPQFGLDFYNKPFVPTRGTQYEVGVKTDLLNNKLSATLSVYQLALTNVLTADPNNRFNSIQVGEQRSRGGELVVTGQLAPGWDIIAAYNYTNARVASDNRYKVGYLLPGSPIDSASLWTTYTIPGGKLQGLGFGFGVHYIGDRFGDLLHSFHLPSFVRTDAALYYRRNNVSVGLNIFNVFNIKYYEAAATQTNIYPGAPISAQLTIKWQFR